MQKVRDQMWAFSAAFLILELILLGLAQPAQALSPAAQAEAQAIHEVATTIRQNEERSRNLKTQVDAILRNLERRGAQAKGDVPGWQRLLSNLRSEAARMREARAALRSDALNSESETREATTALRTLRDLGQRLRRLDEVIAGAAQSLDKLQSRMREPEPPRAETAVPTPQRAKSQTSKQLPPEEERKQVDLSGTWLQGKEEWEIKHNPQDGTIIILDPVKHLPGRYLEFKGSVKGATITASYQVTDVEVLNPELPEKVRQQDAARRPTWRLKLQLTKEEKLEGSREVNRLSWNKKTLKITQTRPESNKVVLARKEGRPTLATLPFLPLPITAKRGPLSILSPESPGGGPRPARNDVSGLWETTTGKVALAQKGGKVRGRGVRKRDGCVDEYEGRVTVGPDGTTSVQLKNTSLDLACYDNFPSQVASKIVGKVSNDLKLKLGDGNNALRGESRHDSVTFDTRTFQVARISKADRFTAWWKQVTLSCPDPTPPPRPSTAKTRQQSAPTPGITSATDSPTSNEAQTRREEEQRHRQEREQLRLMTEQIDERAHINRRYRGEFESLRDDLLREHRRLTGTEPSAEVRVEAEYIATHMVDIWQSRRNVSGWRGGWDDSVLQLVDDLGNWATGRESELRYGSCNNWAFAFGEEWESLDPQPSYFEGVQLRARPRGIFEHNAYGIRPRIPGPQERARPEFDYTLVLDPWRSDGDWHHGQAVDDRFEWHRNAGFGGGR